MIDVRTVKQVWKETNRTMAAVLATRAAIDLGVPVTWFTRDLDGAVEAVVERLSKNDASWARYHYTIDVNDTFIRFVKFEPSGSVEHSLVVIMEDCEDVPPEVLQEIRLVASHVKGLNPVTIQW